MLGRARFSTTYSVHLDGVSQTASISSAPLGAVKESGGAVSHTPQPWPFLDCPVYKGSFCMMWIWLMEEEGRLNSSLASVF